MLFIPLWERKGTDGDLMGFVSGGKAGGHLWFMGGFSPAKGGRIEFGRCQVWGVMSMESEFILNDLNSGSGEYGEGNMGNLREGGSDRRRLWIMGGSSMVIPLSQWCHVLSDKMWRG
jgi:hypothetical protein